MSGIDRAAERNRFADLVCGPDADPRLRAAFAAVKREDFAGPGPWHLTHGGVGYELTPDADPARLYRDVLVALDPARGINIGQPSLHARCLAALAVVVGERVIQIGAGSGYYTAILAELTGPTGRVDAYEIDPALAARAAANLADWPNVRVHAQSGVGRRLGPADAIDVFAAATAPDPAWLDALAPGGRLLFPLAPPRAPGAMLLVTRDHAGYGARFLCRAGFIGCAGAQDPDDAERLARAFARGGWERVKRLRRGETGGWYGGPDWCLTE